MKKSAIRSVVGALDWNVSGWQLDQQFQGAGFNSPAGNWIKKQKTSCTFGSKQQNGPICLSELDTLVATIPNLSRLFKFETM